MKLSKRHFAAGMCVVLSCQMLAVPKVEAGRRLGCRAANRTTLLPRRRQAPLSTQLYGRDHVAEQENEVVDPNWGTLRGKFVFGGDPPSQHPISVREGLGPLYDESLLVDQKSRGVANVVVWLFPDRKQSPEVHPSYDAARNDEVRLVVTDLRFEPRVIVLRTLQTLSISNQAKGGRIVKIDTFNNPPLGSALTAEWSLKYDQPERLPTPVSDGAAPWMRGHMVLLDHPYAAASRSDGSFQLRNLPVGTWTFKVWHERTGYVDDVTIGDEPRPLKFGRLTITIKPGDNDLGEMVIPAAELDDGR